MGVISLTLTSLEAMVFVWVYLIHEPAELHNYSPLLYKDAMVISTSVGVGSVHGL